MRFLAVWWAVAAVLSLSQSAAVEASSSNHRFSEKDVIPLYVNKVGPFNNPQEFYRFYSLPYCSETNPHRPFRRLGEAIEGYDLTKSPVEMQFKGIWRALFSSVHICSRRTPTAVTEKPRLLCNLELTSEDANKFKYAISRRYWMQMFLDDLPIYGLVGEISDGATQQVFWAVAMCET